jgi:acetoin utilization deacetylase AcuC-like enzyme
MLDGFDGPAFISVRPPGHHATTNQAMGFCLFNNIAVTAARLRDDGNRVAIVDWDVHHGNGTQGMFLGDPAVLYVSIHQFPFYPHEGSVAEVGRGDGVGTNLNIPVPAFTAGDVYLTAVREIVIPALRAFAPDWLLVSSGFDAHAHDPLAELRLVEADYGTFAQLVTAVVPPRRTLAFLEGGYHLPALRDSVAAVVRGLVGEPVDAKPSPFTSPPESYRYLEEVRKALEGRVVGVG